MSLLSLPALTQRTVNWTTSRSEALVQPRYKKSIAELERLPSWPDSDSDQNIAPPDKSEQSAEVSSRNIPPDSTPSNLTRESTPASLEPREEWLDLLRNVFGLETFHDKQLEALHAALSGRDTFVNLHTGSGKSLIYQLAALLENQQRGAVTFVFGPIVALKNDQMKKCEALGINAATIDSQTSADERIQTCDRLRADWPDIALFFLTPEMVGVPVCLSFCNAYDTVFPAP